MENLEKLKELRKKTGLSIKECQDALKESNFDLELANKILSEKIKSIVSTKLGRETSCGLFGVYLHSNSTMLGIVELLCETDFVSKNSEFKNLANDLAAQVLFSNTVKYVAKENMPYDQLSIYSEEDFNNIFLISQPFYKNPLISVETLIKEYSAKFGENIVIANFYRFLIK